MAVTAHMPSLCSRSSLCPWWHSGPALHSPTCVSASFVLNVDHSKAALLVMKQSSGHHSCRLAGTTVGD